MTHTVLIADDEPNIVISLEFLMKREGHRVLVARDGAQALEAIRRDRPDLVLLDVMMPVLTGFEVCQQVRADESLAGTKILLLTAKGRDTDVAQGLGLPISRQIVEHFGGRLWLRSEPGQGACFGFDLPWQRQQDKETPP